MGGAVFGHSMVNCIMPFKGTYNLLWEGYGARRTHARLALERAEVGAQYSITGAHQILNTVTYVHCILYASGAILGWRTGWLIAMTTFISIILRRRGSLWVPGASAK